MSHNPSRSTCPHCKGRFGSSVGLCAAHVKGLTKQWYKVAADSGFHDIEQEDGNLRRWHGADFVQNYSPERFNAKADYYRKADQFGFRHVFDSDADKLIWTMHSSGLTIREIERAVQAVPGIKAQRETIRKTIVRIRDVMLKTPW